MKKKAHLFITTCVIFILLAFVSVAEALSYKISTQVFDAGGGSSLSTSYRFIGKARGHEISIMTGPGVVLGAGFLRTAYFAQPALGPIVTGISPSSAPNSGPVEISALTGANFMPGAVVKLSRSGLPDILATNVVVVNSGKIICRIDITSALSGLWDVTVTNMDGRSGTLPSAFSISYPPPQIDSITPRKGLNNSAVDITDLAGKYFRPGATVKLSRSGQTDITATNVTVNSPQKITCRFDLSGKETGQWDVTVTNDDDQAAVMYLAFDIESPDLYVTEPVVSIKNPFDPGTGPTTIKYSLSKDADITLYIFNIRGERIWQWKAPAGSQGGKVGVNEVTWDGITAFSSYASVGVYFVHVTATVDGGIKTLSKTKIALIR